MRKRIKKFSKRITNRENITAAGILIAIAGVIVILMTLVVVFEKYNNFKKEKESRHNVYEDEVRKLAGITTNLEPVPDMTANWKSFDGSKYNFSIKYPTGWGASEMTADPGGKYLDKISFTDAGSGNGQMGFDVFLYDSSKFTDPSATSNLEKKNPAATISDCPSFDDITLGEDRYPAKEINIAANNPCWKETFFYSLTRGPYMYNIIPYFGNGYNIPNSEEKISLIKVFPEFYDIVSTLNISDQSTEIAKVVQEAKRVYAAAAKPKVRYVAGRTCPNKHDHPSYSDKGKGRHMDEDCCPDPDEWPNPMCAYSAKQLNVMIKGHL